MCEGNSCPWLSQCHLPARLRRPQDPPSSRFHVQKMVARMRGPGSATSHPRPMDPGTESVKCELQPRYHCVHPPSRCGLEPAARFAMSQLLPVARAFSSASFSYCAGPCLPSRTTRRPGHLIKKNWPLGGQNFRRGLVGPDLRQAQETHREGDEEGPRGGSSGPSHTAPLSRTPTRWTKSSARSARSSVASRLVVVLFPGPRLKLEKRSRKSQRPWPSRASTQPFGQTIHSSLGIAGESPAVAIQYGKRPTGDLGQGGRGAAAVRGLGDMRWQFLLISCSMKDHQDSDNPPKRCRRVADRGRRCCGEDSSIHPGAGRLGELGWTGVST